MILLSVVPKPKWIPACAGMTASKELDSSLTRAILALALRAGFAVRARSRRAQSLE
jgi:hypothetical protein